ncbi:SNARE associated Golgi protein [Thraustotheca clavata]|uniref:SNARE associated Golgi protein n=1 Tax=Thraustotheca clavata TaxID=74557 RepID=A0A1V9YFY8_9STRA|nr:SNARE associated Golgi protein [Thraustotheca clavata]
MHSPAHVESLLRVEKHVVRDVSSNEDVENLFHSYGWTTTTSTYFTLKSERNDEELKLASNMKVPTYYNAPCLTSMDMTASLAFLNDVFDAFTEKSNASSIIVAPLSNTDKINCDVMTKAYLYNYAGVIFHTENPSSQSSRICTDLDKSLDITPGYSFVKGAPRLSINAARQRLSIPSYVSLINQVVLNDLRNSGVVHISRACQNTINPVNVVVGHLDGKDDKGTVLLGGHENAALIQVLQDLHTLQNKGWVPEKSIKIAFWQSTNAIMEWYEDSKNLQTIDAAIHFNSARQINPPNQFAVPLYNAKTSKETFQLIMRILDIHLRISPVEGMSSSDLRHRHVASNESNEKEIIAIEYSVDDEMIRRDVRALVGIFIVSVTFVVFAIYYLVVDDLAPEEQAAIKFPTSLTVAQELGHALMSYAHHSPGRLLVAHGLMYLFLQTWAIPGTVFINLLGGALFGLTLGFPLCLCYNTLGSCFMYGLSRQFGGALVKRHFPAKLEQLHQMIDGHRNELTLYMIFLRIFPFTPNWFINMSSPHLSIPLRQFAPSVCIGLIPYNFLSCKAGLILSHLQSKSDIIDTETTIQLIVVAVAGFIILPRLKKHFAS